MSTSPVTQPQIGLRTSPNRSGLTPVNVLSAQEIFKGKREICIDFQGVKYRLRITRKNKLILQK